MHAEKELSPHFVMRFNQRVARSKRMWLFVQRAFHYGTSIEDLPKSKYSRQLAERAKNNNSYARIYHGFVYWFRGNVAITIYPVSQFEREYLC